MVHKGCKYAVKKGYEGDCEHCPFEECLLIQNQQKYARTTKQGTLDKHDLK